MHIELSSPASTPASAVTAASSTPSVFAFADADQRNQGMGYGLKTVAALGAMAETCASLSRKFWSLETDGKGTQLATAGKAGALDLLEGSVQEIMVRMSKKPTKTQLALVPCECLGPDVQPISQDGEGLELGQVRDVAVPSKSTTPEDACARLGRFWLSCVPALERAGNVLQDIECRLGSFAANGAFAGPLAAPLDVEVPKIAKNGRAKVCKIRLPRLAPAKAPLGGARLRKAMGYAAASVALKETLSVSELAERNLGLCATLGVLIAGIDEGVGLLGGALARLSPAFYDLGMCRQGKELEDAGYAERADFVSGQLQGRLDACAASQVSQSGQTSHPGPARHHRPVADATCEGLFVGVHAALSGLCQADPSRKAQMERLDLGVWLTSLCCTLLEHMGSLYRRIRRMAALRTLKADGRPNCAGAGLTGKNDVACGKAEPAQAATQGVPEIPPLGGVFSTILKLLGAQKTASCASAAKGQAASGTRVEPGLGQKGQLAAGLAQPCAQSAPSSQTASATQSQGLSGALAGSSATKTAQTLGSAGSSSQTVVKSQRDRARHRADRKRERQARKQGRRK